ncbi:unnamed protein product [Arctogadus glacialis]
MNLRKHFFQQVIHRMSEVLNPPDPERADLPPEKSEVLNLPDPERADLPPDKSEVLKPQTTGRYSTGAIRGAELRRPRTGRSSNGAIRGAEPRSRYSLSPVTNQPHTVDYNSSYSINKLDFINICSDRSVSWADKANNQDLHTAQPISTRLAELTEGLTGKLIAWQRRGQRRIEGQMLGSAWKEVQIL